MDFELMDPTGGREAQTSYQTAPRLADIRGTRVGLLDNSKTNAAKFLTMVAEILTETYGVREVRILQKPALSKPAPTEIIDELVNNSDFVVTGIGDCGSCSTNSVHDAIEIEKRHVPAVAVCTEAFVPGLDALAKMRGMPDYHFAVVPHPLGVLFDDELRQRAALAAPQVAAIVMARTGASRAAASS